MFVNFLRSSSLGALEFCEMKYFFVYVLGWKDKQNKKSTMGTIVHRALQILGDKKIAIKNGKKIVENDDLIDLTLGQCDDIEYITELCFDYYSQAEDTLSFDKRFRAVHFMDA